MKRLIYLLVVLGASVNVQAQDMMVKKTGDTIVCKVAEVGLNVVKYRKAGNPAGPLNFINKSKLDYILYENGERDNLVKSVNGHEYVDLGLPSGILWATCNVGASKPEEFGKYFAWGETQAKEDYSWANYKWCNGSKDTQTKYKLDSLNVIASDDDAAAANWGRVWRMPTKIELMEMTDGCKWKWVSNYNGSGVSGRLGTSKTNGNTIFLPAAGVRDGKNLSSVGSYDDYWTSTLSENSSTFAYSLKFGSDDVAIEDDSRHAGRSVRAVVKK